KVLIQCPSLSHCNRPGNAVLTLGRIPGEDGINIQQPTGSTFRVHGVVFSNSNLNVVNGALNTNTAAYARGACTGTVQSVPAPRCNYGSAANPLGDDPGYASVLTSVPAHRALPACTTPNSVVTFQPGYYDDAAGLTAMMAGNSACKHSTWWFTPGAYYFDFHNGTNPLLPSGDDLWTIDDGYLVAGTPVNAGGRVVATPAVPATIPGACDNPINDAHAVGNQSASLTVNGFAPPAIPAGSILKTAQLRVVHGNSAGSTQDNLSVQLTPSGGAPSTFNVPSYGDNVLHADLIDVSTSALAQAVYNGTLTGAQLNYSAAVKHKGVESVDAL